MLKVGAQTETELKEKKLRVEDALNATKVIFLMPLRKQSLYCSYVPGKLFGLKSFFISMVFRLPLRKVLWLVVDAPC